MKKILKRIGFIFLIFIIIASIGMGYFIGNETFKGLTNIMPREETVENISLYKDKYKKFAEDKKIKEIKIKSSKFDHEIPGVFVENKNTNNIAVMVHGLCGTKYSMSSQAQGLYDLGFSLLIFDQRNSGKNLAKYSTFGVLESYDCLDYLKYAKNNIKKDGKILLYGESYGGASSIIAASRDDSLIDYMILDCPVSDSNEFSDKVFKKIEKNQGVPVALMKFIGNIFLKTKLGFSLKDIDTRKWLENTEIKCPVLIINSNSDKVTPYHMGEDIYKAINSDKKEIYTCKEIPHTKFAEKEPENFKNIISKFLKKYK